MPSIFPVSISSPMDSSVNGNCPVERLDPGIDACERLPDTIGGMKKLNTLWLANNELASIPDTIDGCTKLSDLYINSNNLDALPASLARCPLSDLNVAGNLVNMHWLNFRNNCLRELPGEFTKLKQLTMLRLDTTSSTISPQPRAAS
ncbi:hypothetical protein GF325_08575 [Candidatus Bathyarchaeota archaeon]|nr:hypothetical protein [Candidatus Bathyarchaeota archaeon]